MLICKVGTSERNIPCCLSSFVAAANINSMTNSSVNKNGDDDGKFTSKDEDDDPLMMLSYENAVYPKLNGLLLNSVYCDIFFCIFS